MKLKEKSDHLRHIFIEVVDCVGDKESRRADTIVGAFVRKAGYMLDRSFLNSINIDEKTQILGLSWETNHNSGSCYIVDMPAQEAKEKLTKLTGLKFLNLKNM